MPQGDKSAYTDKQKRQAEHIEEGYEKRGVSKKTAKKRVKKAAKKTVGKKASKKGKKAPATTEAAAPASETPEASKA